MILKSTVEFFFKPLKLSPNYGGLSRKIFLLHRPLSQKNPNDQPIFEVSWSISGCIPVWDWSKPVSHFLVVHCITHFP
jgi:hypothetical protein